MTNLSKKAEKALEILKAGGEFAERLEASYMGGEKWNYRLLNGGSWNSVVKGFGFKTYWELKNAGLLVLVNSTSVSKYYKLAEVA